MADIFAYAVLFREMERLVIHIHKHDKGCNRKKYTGFGDRNSTEIQSTRNVNYKVHKVPMNLLAICDMVSRQ